MDTLLTRPCFRICQLSNLRPLHLFALPHRPNMEGWHTETCPPCLHVNLSKHFLHLPACPPIYLPIIACTPTCVCTPCVHVRGAGSPSTAASSWWRACLATWATWRPCRTCTSSRKSTSEGVGLGEAQVRVCFEPGRAWERGSVEPGSVQRPLR